MSNVMDMRALHALDMDIRETYRASDAVKLCLFMKDAPVAGAWVPLDPTVSGQQVTITWFGAGTQNSETAMDFCIGLAKLTHMADHLYREEKEKRAK